MEGQLNQDDSILKVAVKTMKSEYVDVCKQWCCSPSPYPKPLPYAPESTSVPSKKIEPEPGT